MGRDRSDNVALERLSVLNLAVIILGGSLAFWLINPALEAGPVRVGTYVFYWISTVLMGRKHLRIVRSSSDGKASIYVVASTYFWLFFNAATLFITYLVAARAFGFAPHIPEALQLRISYFFISGSAVGALFAAVVFNALSTETLMKHRIPAWPLTAFKRSRTTD